MPIYKKKLSPGQALQKLRHYCGYQERCHSEVRDKLFSLGVVRKEHDAIIASLIEDNYLDEERFAMGFAGGRFRINEWGRVKIAYELRQKQVSEYSIKKALRQITDDDYERTLDRLASARWESLRGEDDPHRRSKTMAWLIQRGFESGLVRTAMQKIAGTR